MVAVLGVPRQRAVSMLRRGGRVVVAVLGVVAAMPGVVAAHQYWLRHRGTAEGRPRRSAIARMLSLGTTSCKSRTGHAT
ncbi:hypothetical protein FB03_05895 [Actinotignum schaalii]|nr:hypothetical protein FB03_05895 [Actinotignum schaalii]